MNDTIFYWQGVIGNDVDMSYFSEEIEKLLNGEYQSLNLEKLTGHNVFSIRVNREDRLLFTTIPVQGVPFLLLLDVVLNHDYAKSKFLKPAVLKQFLEKNAYHFSETISAETFKKAAQIPGVTPGKTTKPKFHPLHYYNQMFVQLNDEQNSALNVEALPLVLIGAPGSGKSLLAVPLLTQAQEHFKKEKNPRIIYLTKSKFLTEKMKSIWEASPAGQNQTHPVEFLTYSELMQSLGIVITEDNLVKDKYCLEWLKKEFPRLNASLVFQEFRLISAYPGEEYEALSPRYTLFKTPAERALILKAYKAYLAHLADAYKIHPAFYTLPDEKCIHFLFTDEAQDFSRLQFKNLQKITHNNHWIISLDSNQSISDSISIISYAKSLCPKGNKPVILSSSYRCPELIVNIANTLLTIKRQVTGGLADKDETRYIQLPANHQPHPGSVRWVHSLNSADFCANLREKEARSTDFAVVTPAEFKAEAMLLFKTPLIFTPEEIKGLEYPTVLAFRVFDTPEFRAAGKYLRKNPEMAVPLNRAKQGRERFDDLGPAFNEVYTALTRATQNLIIYQDNSHALEPVLKPLYDLIHKEAFRIEPQVKAEKQAVDWAQEAQKQQEIGNTEQAENILKLLDKKSNKSPNIIENNLTGTQKPKKKKTPVAQVDGDEVTVQNILKNKTIIPGFFEQLFNKQPQRALKLLFKTKTETPLQCLFNEMAIQDCFRLSFHRLLTLNFLSNTQVMKEILSQHVDIPPLFCLLLDNTGKRMMKLIARKHPKLLNNIHGEYLCKSIPRFQYNLLLLILSGEYGLEIFQCMLMQNKRLASEITADGLAYSKFQLGSVFLQLCCKDKDLSVVNYLFKKNPKLMLELPDNILFSILDPLDHSVLVCLTATGEGVLLLNKWMLVKPDLLSKITASALFDKSEISHEAPFSNLSTTFLGRKMLHKILSEKPRICGKLPSWVLYSAKSPKLKLINPFFHLSKCTDGIEVLLILFRKNHELLKVTAEQLCWTSSEKGYSAILGLASHKNGATALFAMLNANPDLAAQIPYQALKLQRQLPEGNLCALGFLLKHSQGHRVIQLLIEGNQAVGLDILSRLNESHKKNDVSLLHCLLDSDAGRNIFHVLLRHDWSIIQMMLPKVFSPAVFQQKHHDLSALDYLKSNPERTVLLEEFTRVIPELRSELAEFTMR